MARHSTAVRLRPSRAPSARLLRGPGAPKKRGLQPAIVRVPDLDRNEPAASDSEFVAIMVSGIGLPFVGEWTSVSSAERPIEPLDAETRAELGRMFANYGKTPAPKARHRVWCNRARYPGLVELVLDMVGISPGYVTEVHVGQIADGQKCVEMTLRGPSPSLRTAEDRFKLLCQA